MSVEQKGDRVTFALQCSSVPSTVGRNRGFTGAFRAIVPGLLGSLALLGLYLTIVAGTSRSLGHALELLVDDRYYVTAIAVGLGVQIGLFAHLRRQRRRLQGLGTSKALTATGTGTSTGAMVVCCLHHAADILPLAGLSGAAVFLSQYRTEIMLVGLVANAAGIAFSLRLLHRERRATRQHRLSSS